MRKKHWSSNPGYNQRYWTKGDWEDWEKHGRPKVPIDNRLGFGPDTRVSLDKQPVVAPLHPLADVDWYGKPQPRAGRRGPANPKVDALLAKLGVGRRRRTHAEKLVTRKREKRVEIPPDGVPITRSSGQVLRVR